jgi:glycosyltransferase involved in cell wall biosynthesis
VRNHRILVVGQTPPPLGGQTLMIQRLLNAELYGIHLLHVRLDFTKSMTNIGRASWLKVARLFLIIAKITYTRYVYRASTLYYPPAGPERTTIYRDFAILLSTRWMFRKTIFHFHAVGLSSIFSNLNPVMKALFRQTYAKPDLTISPSRRNPPDGQFLRSRTVRFIPNGIDDPAHQQPHPPKNGPASSSFNLLFVGLLCESKGVLVLLESCVHLAREGHSFIMNLLGHFHTAEFRDQCMSFVQTNRIQDRVFFLGEREGQDKWNIFAKTDIFCFPSHFHSESFGLVVLEAMAFTLPVVATAWRGIPDLVSDGENGFLVPIKDSAATASKIAALMLSPELRKRFGENGRKKYEERFTAGQWVRSMNEALFATVSKKP